MTHPGTHLLDSITRHVATVGATRSASRACAAWPSVSPLLASASPAAVAEAGRASDAVVCDEILDALIEAGGQWAKLTALAVLAPRLAVALAAWAGGGARGAVLDDLEGELICRALESLGCPERPLLPPGGVAVWVTRRAWGQTRTRHVTARRRGSRSVPLPDPLPAPAAGQTGIDLLAGALVQPAVVAASTRRSRRALYLTRVDGCSTADAARLLGSSPGSVRVLRARAAHAVAAHAWAA